MKYLALAVVALLAAGCSSLDDKLQVTVAANTRDLRLIQDAVVPSLPKHMVKDWTENLLAFTVRSQAIESALRGEKVFDQAAAESAEKARVQKARGEFGIE